MSEFKGTKGKWEFHESKGLFITTVGAIFRKDKSRLEQRSNAKLISKAPEMLEMLETMKKELYWCINKLQEYGEEVDFQTIAEVNQLIKEATE
ncbi:hypothetical protein CMU99_16250 [Elizabethkingia anophelis]|nr:hypothetical protein [Elizabethkingia anophelis]